MTTQPPTRRRTGPTCLAAPLEHAEQRTFVEWFRWTHKGTRIFAIPNGGLRRKAVAGKLKAEGVEPGVPDLHVPAWRLWIEMKRIGGDPPTAGQLDWHRYLRACGDTVLVAYGCADAIRQVEAFLKERESAACWLTTDAGAEHHPLTQSLKEQ